MLAADLRTKAVTLRIPAPEYRLLASYAHLSGQSMNMVVVFALRSYLVQQATAEYMAELVTRLRAAYGLDEPGAASSTHR